MRDHSLTGRRHAQEQRAQYNRAAYLKRKEKLADRGKVLMKLVHINLPATHVAQMNRMASEALLAGKGPWKSMQEVARALIAAGFEHFKNQSDEMREFMPQFELEHQLSTIARSKQTAHSMLALARENIGSLIDIDADDEALRYYASAMERAGELPQTVWSRWLIEQLIKAFPDLEKEALAGRVPKVQLLRARKMLADVRRGIRTTASRVDKRTR